MNTASCLTWLGS